MSEAGKRLIESAEQALAFAFAEGREGPQGYHVHIPEGIDVRRIREQFHMSQAQFAREFGFSVRTLQEWEQGRSVPGGVSKHFLVVLQKEPEAVRRALAG